MIAELIEFLKTNSAISALVGTRIHIEWIPQGGALPALTVWTIGGSTRIYVDGTKQLQETRYQFDCWAKLYSEAHAIRSAVLAALNGFVGYMGDKRVALALCDGERDLSDLEGDRSTRRISLDFDITHEE